jgi:biotin transport system ATP-binding protein
VYTSEKTGLVFQEPDSQILGETVREDIAFGPRNCGCSKEEVRIRVEDALLKTGLADRADFPCRPLSGGEKRRLAVAGILAIDAHIIIFDEPYANMDYPGVVQVNALIRQLKQDGKTIIILSHELEKCFALADRFIVLCLGKKVFDGDVKDALNCRLENWGIHNPLAKDSEGLLWQ